MLALAGLAVAAYLGGYQAGWWTSVWEPLFGSGSAAVLHSSVARTLPVPDAWLGAAGYLLELILELSGGDARWRDRPRLTAVNMALVAAMALGSVGLLAVQGLALHAWCTLCLASVGCSLAIALVSWPEVRAVARSLVRTEA